MSRSRELTADGMIRALSAGLHRPAAAATHRRADALAATLAEDGLTARVEAGEDGGARVVVTGPGLFGRAFGGLDRPADADLAALLRGRAGRAMR